MCGRFSYFIGNDILQKYFQVPEISNEIQPKYNVAPNDFTFVVVNKGNNTLKQMRWGLLPHWSPNDSNSMKMINARAETVWQKSAFKHSIAKKRCIIPVSGFFEWKTLNSRKIPYFIFLKGQELMPLGGIYDVWYSDFGYTVTTFSIITTEANKTISEIHNRMPLILNQQNSEKWLDPSLNEKMVNALMRPYEGSIKHYTVSSYVNNPKNKLKECIEEFTYKEEYRSLNDYF
ncbi:MAG: SOS response-associated peptidase [Candidatus Kariarchaeaceae archaeon]|jgi:putative SOS response-associated peptidase YedK